ncbi:MAG: PorV/PorQ family protein [Elusimicrobia bacterium]|nr:PorV/PorQ family protein [Elusimicrobiota bacterium]
MKHIKTIGLMSFACLLPFAQAKAKSAGTTAVPFLSMGVGARALAMGEAATGATSDATALYWNPGALTRLEGHSATFMHSTALEESALDYAAYGRGNGKSAWGVGLQYFSPGDVDQTDLTGAPMGTLTPNDVSLTGGYARTVSGYGIGLSVKYVQSKLVDTARTLAADGGVMSPAFWKNRLRVGGSVANLGGHIKYDQESAPLPLILRGGLEARPWKDWTGALDVVAPKDENLHLALGAEYRLTMGSDLSLALRGGYNSRESTGGSAEGLSAGLGFGWRKLVVDYAFVSHGDLDPGQVISVKFGF